MTTRARALLALLLAPVLVVAASGCGALPGNGGTRHSAILKTATGLYPNADVRVLGVKVGTIDDVRPEGTLVRVDFHLESGVQVPADARAAVVAPTVVADRFLQLAPVYTGGPAMPDGAVIPKERTATPAEFDDLLAAAQKLSRSLGPQGVNSEGALSEALTTASKNLDGNGQRLNTTLDNTSQALNTLSASREDLAGTIRGLQSFTSNLKSNDGQLRAFTKQAAEVNGFLADERQNLGQTLRELSLALGDVARFVKDNRAEIKTNVDQLSDVLATINGERLALEQVLETAPAGLDGLVNGYNAGTATLDTRTNILGLLFCVLGSSLAPLFMAPVVGPVLQAFFGFALNTVFPGLLAQCAALPLPTGAAANGTGATATPLSLPPSTTARLNDPRLAAAARALADPAAMRAATTPRGPTAARRGGPAPAPKSLEQLFGGGR